MARSEFGGVIEAWVVLTEVLNGKDAIVLPTDTEVLAIYDAPGGVGGLVTDFLDADGSPATQITVSAGNPYIPRFSGPDGVESLWIEAGTGNWMPIPHYDDGTGSDQAVGSAGMQAVADGDATNATTSPVQVSGVALTVPGPGVYAFRFDLVVETTSGAVDTQWSMVGPAVASVRIAYRRFSASAGSNASLTAALATTATSGTGGIVSNTPYRQVIEGAIEASGAGTLVPQFNPASAATTVTVRALSTGRLKAAGADGSGGSGDVQLAGGNTYEYMDSQSPPWLILKRPNDNTPSGAWSNAWEFWYFDNSTGQYRLGFYVNEKMLGRVRGTTPSDVPFRVMAHPSHQANTAIFEVTEDDNTVKLAQFFPTQAVYEVPVVVPYLVNPLGERLYFGSADPEADPAYADYRPDIGSAWIDYNNPPA